MKTEIRDVEFLSLFIAKINKKIPLCHILQW